MLKRPLEYWEDYQERHPGFITMVVHYENAILPICPYCGSWHTAKVGAGIVGVAIHLLAATTKFKLNPNNPGRYYCNICEGYFTPEGWDKPIWWHELIGEEA